MDRKTPQPSLIGKITSALETCLVSLLIFVAPTNLHLGLFKDIAYQHGILVDYLLPKLYASDLVILTILGLWLLKSLPRLVKIIIKRKPFTSTIHYSPFTIQTPLFTILILSLLAILITSSIFSPRPISGYWYLIKLLEMILLFYWLKTHLKPTSLTKPLAFTLLFQALVGIAQWIQKKSLLGYLFLGETTLKTTSNIAKTSLGGEIRPLPYGTTPHPNILAGFLAIGLLLLLVIRTLKNKPTIQHSLFNIQNRFIQALLNLIPKALSFATLLIFVLILLTTLLLTQSITAVLALTIGLISLRGKHFHKQNLISLVAIAASLFLIAYPFTDATSTTRRIKLAEIALKMVQDKPVLGIGPNNFTAAMQQYGEVEGNIRFIQPVHNIYLLWLSETGFISTLLILLLVWEKRNYLSKLFAQRPASPAGGFTLFVPFIMLLTIGLTDHYPLTHQTGLILFALTLALPFTKQSTKEKLS